MIGGLGKEREQKKSWGNYLLARFWYVQASAFTYDRSFKSSHLDENILIQPSFLSSFFSPSLIL